MTIRGPTRLLRGNPSGSRDKHVRERIRADCEGLQAGEGRKGSLLDPVEQKNQKKEEKQRRTRRGAPQMGRLRSELCRVHSRLLSSFEADKQKQMEERICQVTGTSATLAKPPLSARPLTI